MYRQTTRFMLVLCGVLLLAIPVMVQGQQDAPAPVREAAIKAAQDAIPTLGRPNSWTWELLQPVESTTLGCPLATGVTLPAPVTPYRMTLTYPDGTSYVVHVSADATQTQLCDEKFDTTQDATDDATVVPADCIITAVADGSLYTRPDFTSEAAGVTFTSGNTADGFGRTADNQWYQVRFFGETIAWVSAGVVSVSDACLSLPVSAAVDPDAVTTACFVAPAGAFANIRQQPDVNAAQVDTIYENSTWQVLARNTDGTWYFIEPGWVALTVVTAEGDCTGVPIDDTRVGTGGVVVTGDAPAQTVTGLLDEFACPAGFTDYLPPRLTIGPATARVQEGGLPNTLRSAPTTDASIGRRIGQAQPGRTLDRVLNGPACSNGFVWWLVEIDGTIGWTAESDAREQAYYLEPTSGNAATTVVSPVQPTPVPVTGSGTGTGTGNNSALISDEGIALLSGISGSAPVVDLLFVSDGSELVVLGAANPAIEILDIAARDRTGRTLRPDVPVLTVELASAVDETASLDTAGTLRLWDVATASVLREIESVAEPPFGGSDLDFNSTGSLFVSSGCAESQADTCTRGQVELWNATSGQPLRLQPAHPTAPIVTRFSPDDALLASAATDGIQIWDVQSGAFVTAFAKDGDLPVYDLVWLPQNAGVIQATCGQEQAGDDGTPECLQSDVRVWNLDSGSADLILGDHAGSARALAISPDGTRFASGGEDGMIYVYDTQTGAQIAAFSGHPGAVLTLAFSPDGTLLASGGDQETVFLWELP